VWVPAQFRPQEAPKATPCAKQWGPKSAVPTQYYRALVHTIASVPIANRRMAIRSWDPSINTLNWLIQISVSQSDAPITRRHPTPFQAIANTPRPSGPGPSAKDVE